MSKHSHDNKYTQARGVPQVMLADGDTLIYVSTHDEGQSTALYRVGVDDAILHEEPLPCGAVSLTTAGEHVFLAGQNGQLYKAPRRAGAPEPFGGLLDPPPSDLVAVSGDALAVLSGNSLLIVATGDGEVLQRLPLPEVGQALAVDPSGQWLVVGGNSGTLSVFEAESKPQWQAAESKKVHEGTVTALLFEVDELRVISAGVDNRIFLTHVRGALEPEDRSGKNGHKDMVRAIVHGLAGRFVTAGKDATLKAWPGGGGQRRPATFSDRVGKVMDLSLVKYRGRTHLAAACEDGTIRLFTLDENGKVEERVRVIHGAQGWASHNLRKKDPKIREHALRTLARWNDASAIGQLSGQVEADEDHTLRVLATTLLGETKNPRAIPALETLLRHHEEDVRMAAFQGLRALTGSDSLRPLELALKVGKRDVGTAAVHALEKLAESDELAMDRLIAALSDNPAEVRKAALIALEGLHPKDSPEAEITALRAGKPDIRKLAIIRTWQRELIDHPDVRSALRRYGADDDAEVRRTAFLVSLYRRPRVADAMRARDEQIHRKLHEIETAPELGQKPADPAPELPEPKQVAITSVSEDDRRPLLEAMASRALDTCLSGAMGLASLVDPRALGTLLQLSRERDANVRVATCRALADLGDHRGGQRLRLLLRDSQASVRDAAFSALARLEEDKPLTVAEAGLLAEHEDVRRRGLDLLVKTFKQARNHQGEPAPRGAITDFVDVDAEPRTSDDSVYQTCLRLLSRALSDAGRSVRNEAFKAVLNLEVEGRGPGCLRFALRSIHADIRREVLTEVQAQASESWAWTLLLELFGDPDPGVRSDAFKFAMKRTKGIGQEPLAAALECRYPDLRIEATTILGKRKAEGIRALLTKAVEDDDERVRKMAVDALLVNDDEALHKVMHSKHVDVAVRAAAARAKHGDTDALEPLCNIIRSDPPEVKELHRAWAGRMVLALAGLAELGEPAARKDVQALIDHKDAAIRKAAATALAWMARPKELDELRDALQHSDKAVQREAALGLAYCGDPGGASILFADGRKSSSDLATLYAALALGVEAEDVFLAFLDVDDRKIRRRALLLLLLQELREDDGVPDRCLAALSSAHPRIRLSAAQALEKFGVRDDFADYVCSLVNDRGDNKPPWTIDRKVVETIGELTAHGDILGNPQLKVRTARLLELLDHDRQEGFDRAWAVFEARHTHTLAERRALSTLDDAFDDGPGFDLAELRQIVFGAYAGLSRLPGGNLETRVRLTAIARLVATAEADERVLEAVFSTLLLSLADSQAAVRKSAFDSLRELGFPSEDLASEALATGQRDTGAAGLKLLATMEGQDSGLKLVEEVLLQNTDGLEYEAANLLVQLQEGDSEDPEQKAQRRQELTIAVHRTALDARSEKLRMHAIKDLGSRYEAAGSGPAIDAMVHALDSRFRKVRLAAAKSLAQHQNAAAFEVLVSMLRSDASAEQRDAISHLEKLGDPRATTAMMDRIDNDPAGNAEVDRLLAAVGGFRRVEDVDRLLAYFEGPNTRPKNAAWTAMVGISGYDQRIEDPEDEGKGADDWESRQHPRHDSVLAKLLTCGYRQGADRLVMQLLPGARWSKSSAVDQPLAALTGHSKDEVRHGALSAIGWRLRKRKGPPDPLLRALKSRDPQSQFLGAEGLALAGQGDGVSILLTSVDLMADLDLRRRAVHALGELGDARALDTLLRLVNDEGHALQETAAEALGHMGKAAPERAEKVFGILSKLSKGSGGVACQALTGLRHFDTHEAWKIVRSRAGDDNWRVRERVAALLAHNDDPATREIYTDRLRNETFARVAKALASGFRELAGEDSLEPDYVLVQSRHRNLEPNTLERLCERGDAERLLEILPLITQTDYRDRIVAALLARTPLPLAAAAEMLSAPHPISAVTAAKILGYAGDKLEDSFRDKLEDALTRAMETWREQLILAQDRRKHRLDEVTPPVRQMIWACGQLGIGGAQVIEATALGDDDNRGQRLRREAVLALTRGVGGADGIACLRDLVAGTNAELRAIAAGGLAGLDASAAASVVAKSVDDATSLGRLATPDARGQQSAREALQAVAGDVHRQGVVLPHLVALDAVATFEGVLSDAERPDHARLGAIEGLAKIGSDAACDALATFGRDEAEDEELRKAAWRGIRRAKRQRAQADRPRSSRWEVQL